jgi:hypothetical protein
MTTAQIQLLIDAINDGGENTASEVRTVLNAMRGEVCKLYEVKEIDVNLTANPDYLTDNFDLTGLGINEMVGFAICNGANGTKNRKGRTSIGYDVDNYPTLGAIAGSKDQVVISHTHGYKDAVLAQRDDIAVPYADGYDAIGPNVQGAAGDTNNNALWFKNRTTNTTGESGAGKNMQPYIVTLMIQRIS